MTAPTKKLTAAAESYFADLRQVRASGTGTGERSYYPALANLLVAVGGTLKPRVFCVHERADPGAAIPTTPSTRRSRCRGGGRGKDRFRSAGSWR